MSARLSIRLILSDFINHYPREFGALFFLLIIEGVLAAISVVTIVPMVDFMLDPTLSSPSRITHFVLKQLGYFGLAGGFWIFGGLFTGANFIKGILDVFIRYAILRLKYAVVRGLIGDTLKTFFKARLEFFSESGQGQLLNTMSRELNIVGDSLGALATLLAQIVQLCIYLTVPLWLHAPLTGTVLFLAVLFGFPFIFLFRISYRLGQRNTDTANIAVSVLNELLGAARLIIGFGRQDQAEQQYLKAFDRHVDVTLRSQVLATAAPRLFQPLSMLAVVISLGLYVQNQSPLSELVAIMWSLLAALPILSGVLQGKISINSFLPSYEQLISLRNKAVGLAESQGTLVFNELKTGIEFKNVSFSYPGRAQIFESLNLLIRKGQMTALVGDSGSGKSTITDLVLGLQVPAEGSVLIDDVPLQAWQQNSFREKVGYVPQDPQLFHSSIRDNLLWAYGHAADADLWNALHLANAADFIRQLPQGLNTLVGDRGVRLSGGQRQRIALARALLRKPELLILDEATSSLDSESESSIQCSIEELATTTTILVVAHRLSTILKADQVYVLQRGRIVEQGSFAKLCLEKEGALYAMIQTQSFK